jgi:hypothetical protein
VNRHVFVAAVALSLLACACARRLPPECALPDLEQGKQWLGRAQGALDRGEYSNAVKAARPGIGTVAANYKSKQFSDNSDVLLGLAADAERRGRQDEAARTLISALERQLGTYEWKCTVHPKAG